MPDIPLTDGPPASYRSQTVPKSPLAFVTRRPVAITMFMVALAVFGAVSFAKLNVDLLPEITYPTLTVRTTWAGAAPEDVEERISEKVQETLSTLDDLVRSTSISRAGVSDVVLDFDWGTPMTFAVQDAREKLDSVFLPQDADRPLILRYDPNLDPILRLGIRAPDGDEATTDEERTEQLIQLRWIAENRIKRELESLEGVAAVQIHGGLEEEIRVRVDPFQLAAKRVDPAEVARRLAQENINASGGSLLEGSTEYLVRTVNQFRDIEEIENLPVAQRGGAVIRVRDIGRAERTYAKREVVSRIGGAESVEIAIYREAGANIVQLAERLKDWIFGTEQQQQEAAKLAAKGDGSGGVTVGDRSRVSFLQWRLRDEVKLETLSDQSTFIRDAVDDVKKAAILGALFAVSVIWIFLRRLSATVIIGLSIPISIVVTFAPMFMAGVSLNIMSLGGLALGVGMLVDNAIVVLESITRCREEGDSLQRAAVRGVSEVSGAVIASTLTTVSVFAPIVFVSGIAGQIFGDQALTVVTSLLVSLVVAVLFIPMLASRPQLAGEGPLAGAGPAEAPPRLAADLQRGWGKLVPGLLLFVSRALLAVGGLLVRLGGGVALLLHKLGALITWPFAKAFGVAWGAIERVYPVLLRGALRAPALVLLAGVGLLWLAYERIPRLGVELLPEIHQGEFTAHVKLGVGSPLLVTDRVLRELERDIAAQEGVTMTALTVGVEKETLTREVEGPHTARLTVRMEPNFVTPESEQRLVISTRALIAQHPAVRGVEITRPTPFALEAPIAVEIRGHGLEQIASVAETVRLRLAAMSDLSDVRTTLRPGHPEARITFDREKTLEFGLDLTVISGLVRDQVLGTIPTLFREGDDRIDIRVIGDEALLRSLNDVLDLPVNPAADSPLSLRSVATVEEIEGPAEIRRIGNSRAIVVSATGTGLDLGGLTERIEGELSSIVTPEDVTVSLGGQKREMDEAQSSMRFALLLAIFLVYVVMASQFESLLQPLIILLTVPLAGVGVVLTLEVLGIPISVVVFTGLIMLAGIVVNNAIVLVDRINQKRDQGLAVREAVLDAGRARLRPILMTTATTALGLLPLTGWLKAVPVIGSLGAGEGAELRAPMAVTVISGLVSSTLLTLIVIPCVYLLLARGLRRAPRTP
jgi:HAE1 family hydrophobic/amphiphilic exporter-1